MADLKLGTQIGGNLVWHQGILDLNPVDTKLYFQDQEVLVDTGYQTLKGTMKFSVPANQYDIESVSNLPTGSKSMLRKFRGGINDSIWHETIQSDAYRISRGTTDTDLVMQLTGTGATFQGSVLTNAAQSSAANSFTRKDFVNSEDAKKVNKAGDTMTGFLDFSDNKGIRVSFPGGSVSNNVGVFGGQGDGASRTNTNMQIKSWWGVGFSPSGTRTAVSPGENSIWFDTRNGNMYTVGRTFVGSDKEVYSPLNKPTPGDIDAYTKSEVDEKGWFRVKDERAAMIAPNALQSKTVAAYFTNQSDVTTNWVSGFTVNGWESTYAAWSLFSSARSDADDARLWFKYGRTAWSPSYRIYHENNKPTNVELNLVSRAGDEMTGPLTIRNSTFQCVTGSGARRVMKQLGPQNDAKPVLVLFCPKYIGAALPKSGFVGRVTFDRGATGAALQANYVDISAVTAYTMTDAQIHYASGGTPVKLVYVTHNGVEYLAMYRVAVASATLIIDGYCYGADPILISDATGYVVTDIETRERIYSSNNKPTNVDLNLVSRAGDTLTGSLNGPDFIQTTPQSSNGAASARKDYVDAQDAKMVAKAGDTMTGALIATQFKASSDYGFVRSTNDAQGMFVGADGRTIIGGGTGALILRPQGINNAASESVFNNDGTIAISKTGTADNHLVTKKYVDDKVGTAVQSVTATGAVKSTGGINPVISLANATNAADGAMSFADKAKLDGIPAAAVNRTGDTMTGQLIINNASGLDGIQLLGTPSATGDNARGISGFLADGSKRTWGTGILTTNGVASYAYLGFGESPWGESHWGNSVRVYADKVTSATSISAPDFIQTTAQSTNAAASTRKDYVDAQVGAVDAKNVAKAGDTMTGLLKSTVAGNAINLLGGNIRSNTAQVMSFDGSRYAFVTSIGDVHLCQNSYWDGVSWKKYDNAAVSAHIVIGAGSARIQTSAAGATNPIQNSYDILHTGNITPAHVLPTNISWTGKGIENLVNGCIAWRNYGNGHVIFDASGGKSPTGEAVNNTNPANDWIATYPTLMGWNGTTTYGVRVDRAKTAEATINGLTEGGSHGTLTLSNWIRTTGDSGLFCATYGGGIHMSDVTWVRVYNGKKFYVSNADGDAICTSGGMKADGNGSFNDVQIRSDERLKSNYQPITSALDKVDHLAGITYDKIGKTTREAGIIAQRLKEVLPEATGVVSDSMDADAIEYLTISNSGVNALLVEAIKELTDRVKYLESKIN